MLTSARSGKFAATGVGNLSCSYGETWTGSRPTTGKPERSPDHQRSFGLLREMVSCGRGKAGTATVRCRIRRPEYLDLSGVGIRPARGPGATRTPSTTAAGIAGLQIGQV